jgi:hypothetical protein
METLKRFGPYVAIEVLVPGGTLVALAVWFFRERLSIRDLAVRLLTIWKRRDSC